jgi:hypothetical protein
MRETRYIPRVHTSSTSSKLVLGSPFPSGLLLRLAR